VKTERIEYKLLSLTYKVLTTTQPPYLHHLISVQPPHSTCSSSLVTLARPPTSSLLRITNRSFRYASPFLWNQLPSSLHEPYSSPSVSGLPVHSPTTFSHSVNSPLSPVITPFPRRGVSLVRFSQNLQSLNPVSGALAVKISLDLLKGLWRYGGFKLTGSGYPQIFSALSGKTMRVLPVLQRLGNAYGF